MVIMGVCGALLLAGIAAGVLWSGRPFSPPSSESDLPPGEVARRFAWYASLALTGGVITGITVIGAGGRLAMRLLAVTAGDDAQGRITEAEEVVGKITVDGTIGFMVFTGLLGGATAAALYLVVRRFLPPGRLGGVTFGLALLAVLGTTLDPLRDENPDFDIVGPGWLAVLVFAALAVAFGLTLSGVLASLSHWLPLPSPERRVLIRYAGPAVLAAVLFTVTAALAVLGVAVVALTRWPPLLDAIRSRRWVLYGRALMAVLVLVALPNALTSVVDIASR